MYALNALRVFVQRGRAEALRVAALGVGGRRLVAMCVARSACGFVGIAMLNVAFMLMNFADAFALSLGTLCLSTIFLRASASAAPSGSRGARRSASCSR